MSSGVCYENQIHPVAAELIAHREKQDWGEIANTHSNECTKEIANKFLLCCLIDYRSIAKDAWNRGHHYFEGLNAEDKCELWKIIADTPKEDWTSEENFHKCGLHWMHRAHNRLWQIAINICAFFEGDARKIWQNSTLFDVLCRLYYIGAGDQISRMIVGALKDCGQISSGRSDVKADVHVCRVLGRVFDGKETGPAAAVNMARNMYPTDPWQLDSPLWKLGQDFCDPSSPKCTDCYLQSHCKYAKEHFFGG
jgi:hypothetical protein